MKAEILRLFKGFVGEKSETIHEKALKYGLLIPSTADKVVVDLAIKLYGVDGSLWNQTFHKSWDKVAKAPLEQLVIEQVMHYISTYGFASLGVYSDDTIYIPLEKLEIPELDASSRIKLISIHAYEKEEVKEKLMALLTSGIALSKETINDIKTISDLIDKNRFDEVNNREVRTFLYDKYDIMPKDPEAFLRYLIYKTTGATLKIQNEATYTALNWADKKVVLHMLRSYGDYAKLSSIFLRNKRLFLSLKTSFKEEHRRKCPQLKTKKEVNAIINKLRKLAATYHKPLKPQVLDTLTTHAYTKEQIEQALEQVTLFRAIRCLNALNYRINENEDILYRIRNGRSFVSKVNLEDKAIMEANRDIIECYIVSKLAKKVGQKTICIPEGIVYKAPTSEKQFVNAIPEGSYIELPNENDMIFAVHWNNLPQTKKRFYDYVVDLDLHMMNVSEQFGWNTHYRKHDGSILFSGDVTSAPAPLGATEAYSISVQGENAAYMVTLNDFLGHEEDVPYEFIIAKGKVPHQYARKEQSDYMIDPNAILLKFNFKIEAESRQVTLGFLKINEKGKRFYFQNFGVGASRAVTRRDANTLGAYSYLNSYNDIQVSLNDLLMKAGATIYSSPTYKVEQEVKTVDEKGNIIITYEEKEIPVDMDLSIESLDKTTIIELFSK